MNVRNAIEFFLNGFSCLDFSAADLEELLPPPLDLLVEPEFEVSDGSWAAYFRRDNADLLAAYTDSGGHQGWVRISEVDDAGKPGYQVQHSDWERSMGQYTDEDDDRYGVQVLRTCWTQDDDGWSCWASQVLGWEGDPEEGEPADFDRIVRPPHVLDAAAIQAAYQADLLRNPPTDLHPAPADLENGPDSQSDPVAEYKNRRHMLPGELDEDYHAYVVGLADNAVRYLEQLLDAYTDDLSR